MTSCANFTTNSGKMKNKNLESFNPSAEVHSKCSLNSFWLGSE